MSRAQSLLCETEALPLMDTIKPSTTSTKTLN